jgi:hypothetical protein
VLAAAPASELNRSATEIHMDPLIQGDPILRRAVNALNVGRTIFCVTVGSFLWVWFGSDLQFISALALTSVVSAGLSSTSLILIGLLV